MNIMLKSRSTFFGIGILVGLFSFWGVLSLGHSTPTVEYAGTRPSAVLPAENATTTPAPSYSGASILVWKGDTDSSLNNYQLERDACCPGEAAK
jgi:hypothetical protein